MKIISEHFDEEDIKRAIVSLDDGVYQVSLYYKDELLRVKPFNREQLAEDCAEDWVMTNE